MPIATVKPFSPDFVYTTRAIVEHNCPYFIKPHIESVVVGRVKDVPKNASKGALDNITVKVAAILRIVPVISLDILSITL